MGATESQEVIRAIAALQQDIKHMSRQVETLSAVTEKSIRNEESVKSAHKRIDDTESAIDSLVKELKGAWRAIGGGIASFFISVVLLVISKFL